MARVAEAAERTPDGEWIRAVGMNPHAAVSYFADDRLGTLEVGRLADVVVLDRGPVRDAAEAIADIGVDLTLVSDEIAYDSARLTATSDSIS